MFRTKRVFILLFIVAIFTLAAYMGFDRQVIAESAQTQKTDIPGKTSKDFTLYDAASKRDFGNLPLYFTVNRGQAHDDIKYYSVGSRYGLFLTESGVTLQLVSENPVNSSADNAAHFEKAGNFRTDQVHLNFVGADFSNLPVGENELDGKVNYLVGGDDSQWQTNIPTFAKVRYEKIYPGIDAVFYGNQRELEYDFVVAPQADPRNILLEFKEAKKIKINKRGELVLKLENGEIVQRTPFAYQVVDGQRQKVDVSFVKKGKNKIAFRLGKYDREKELIIDPIIIFSTYFGGSSSESATSVKTDAQGNIFLTGATVSPNFPTVNPLQATLSSNFYLDAFITKLNPAGNGIIYSTYLGGEFDDFATSINVDGGGNIIVAGRTNSANFPNVNALQTQLAGSSDGFIAKLNAQGSALIYSTFLGGSGFDDISSATLDGNGNAIVVGRTESGNFPTVNPFQATISGTSFFRSGNVGASWTSGSLSSAVTTVSAYAVAPTSPNIVLAATNVGVFRSSDGGTVWSAAGQSDLSTPVSKIAIARSNSNIVYAISNGAVFRSINGGTNWTNIQGSLFSFFNTVAVDPNNADIAYVAGFSGAVYKTTDGGTNWTNVSIVNVSSPVYSIVIDPVNTQTIYVGTSQRVYRSTVGGGSWLALSNGFPFTTTVWDLLIDPSSNTLYAATQIGLYKSTDAGANWIHINVNNLTTVRSLAQDPNNSANLFAATNIGLFFRSIDGGATWNQSNTGLTGNSLLTVAATSNSVLLGGYAGTDAFVARLNNAGNALSYSTYLGGNLNDSATGVRIGSDNKIILTGTTNSPNFPVSNAFQSTLGGGNDAFVTKFNENGASLAFSTFLGGASNDSASSLAVDNEGNAYLTGTTISADFPVLNAFQPNCASCGNFSNDVFVTKLNSGGNALVYSSFLGGSFNDNGLSIDVDLQKQAVVVGSTTSNNFPVLDAIQPTIAGSGDGFVSQIKADGSNFVYSTYYGGSGNDSVTSVAIAPEGNAVIIGQTTSFNLPTVSPLQSNIGGSQDAFIAKVGVAADLQIVKTDERDPVMINNPLAYNLRVKNNGPSVVGSAVVTDSFPAGAEFVSAIPTQGNCSTNGTSLTCNLGALALNAEASIRLVLTPTQAGTVSNTATVSGDQPDPVSENNSDTEQTLISALPSIFGKVAARDGQSASNVNIVVEGFQNRTVQTDVNGNYGVAELPFAGNYTVRPVKQGFYFTPRSKIYNSLTQDETADFIIKPCSYTLSETSSTFSAAGGNKSIFITTNDPFCAWTATTSVPWITITSGGSGFGNGTVKILIEASSNQRVGTLTIAGQTFTVTQEGCSFTLMPFQQSFNQSGGAGSIQVSANESFCQWTATTNDSWITIQNGQGTGNGTLNYTVAATTSPRSGRITIGGQNFQVWQESNYCPTPGFAAPVEQIINSESKDIVTADFNGDQFPDLATVDITSTQAATFSVYIGNGDGTFSRVTRATTIGTLASLTVGDFNNDSKQDIALIGAGQIAIYNGDGSGGFTLFGSFNSATGNNSKALAEDFNRDGKVDILVAVTNQIYVLNGNGNSTFTQGFSRPVAGRFSYSFAFGDVNGDGNTDVVIGQEEDFNIPRLIYFFGAADGTFSEGGTASLGDITPFLVKAADLNGDGKADVITNGYLASQVRVFLWNPATSGFRPPVKVFTEPYVAYVFDVADVDNDGKPDIISASNQDFPQRINIMRGNGNGTFRLPIGSASVRSANGFAFADFNRDGRIDVAFAKKVNQMAAQLNQCDPATAERNGVAKFDFDGDRKADFAVIRPSNNTWYIQKGDGQPWVSQKFGTDGDIPAAADYDGDGRTDFAVFRPSSGIWYRLNSSDNSFTTFHWGQNGDIPVPADFDGDERADLAVYRPENNVWYWVSSLNGQTHTIKFGSSEDIPVIGDYDGDAKADIAVFRPSNGFWYWLKSSNGEFQTFRFGLNGDKAVPADYDGDGKTDIAVFRPSDNTWYLMKSSVNEFFATKFGTDGDAPAPADYDGDGKADITVFRNGVWYVQKSASGSLSTIHFGTTADKPVPSIYVR